MIGVGLSASAALSTNPVTSGTAIVLALVFLVLAVLIAVAAQLATVVLVVMLNRKHFRSVPVAAVPAE